MQIKQLVNHHCKLETIISWASRKVNLKNNWNLFGLIAVGIYFVVVVGQGIEIIVGEFVVVGKGFVVEQGLAVIIKGFVELAGLAQHY